MSNGASVPDQALVNHAPAGHGPTGFDPSRDLAGCDEIAAYFDADPREVADHMAWHAGYAAGTKEGAGYSAGYADAERHIMDWLMTPEADGCDILEAITRRRHAQAMSAGTAETVQPAQGEARQRGPKDAPDPSSSSNHQGTDNG